MHVFCGYLQHEDRECRYRPGYDFPFAGAEVEQPAAREPSGKPSLAESSVGVPRDLSARGCELWVNCVLSVVRTLRLYRADLVARIGAPPMRAHMRVRNSRKIRNILVTS